MIPKTLGAVPGLHASRLLGYRSRAHYGFKISYASLKSGSVDKPLKRPYCMPMVGVPLRYSSTIREMNSRTLSAHQIHIAYSPKYFKRMFGETRQNNHRHLPCSSTPGISARGRQQARKHHGKKNAHISDTGNPKHHGSTRTRSNATRPSSPSSSNMAAKVPSPNRLSDIVQRPIPRRKQRDTVLRIHQEVQKQNLAAGHEILLPKTVSNAPIVLFRDFNPDVELSSRECDALILHVADSPEEIMQLEGLFRHNEAIHEKIIQVVNRVIRKEAITAAYSYLDFQQTNDHLNQVSKSSRAKYHRMLSRLPQFDASIGLKTPAAPQPHMEVLRLGRPQWLQLIAINGDEDSVSQLNHLVHGPSILEVLKCGAYFQRAYLSSLENSPEVSGPSDNIADITRLILHLLFYSIAAKPSKSGAVARIIKAVIRDELELCPQNVLRDLQHLFSKNTSKKLSFLARGSFRQHVQAIKQARHADRNPDAREFLSKTTKFNKDQTAINEQKFFQRAEARGDCISVQRYERDMNEQTYLIDDLRSGMTRFTRIVTGNPDLDVKEYNGKRSRKPSRRSNKTRS